MRKITLFLSLVFTTLVLAQVTTVPSIIQKGYNGEITIIFNPNEGNKGMQDATACYAHTGLITSASSSDGDWKNVVENWRENTSKTQLTKDGNNWKLVISNIYEFYGCSADTEIQKMAFVFHDGPGGSKEAKSAEGTDIFVALADPGLAVAITNVLPELSSLNDQLTLHCVATEEAALSLSLNGKEVATGNGTELQYECILETVGDYVFEFTATKGTEKKSVKVQTCVVSAPEQAARPEGIDMGIYYDEKDPTKVTLATFAAGKQVNATEKNITVKAKLPAHWTNTITAYIWVEGADSKVVYPEKDGEWYVVTEFTSQLNVIFRNGEDWTVNKNQTVDIVLTGDAVLEFTQEGEAKAEYKVIEMKPTVYDAAQHVFVVGDFNDWTISNEFQMKQDGSYFWLEITGLTPQQEYAMQYVVVRADGVVKKISDLYSEKVLHKDDQWEPKKVNPDLKEYPAEGDGYVTVLQTDKPAYPWSNATLNFKRPNKNNLVIYEAWVYDHTAERTIAGMMNRLRYFKDLGVNAIELMPMQEFDGNMNWGYSPNHYFALDKAYGSPEEFKTFVDSCHALGIAVILDMVFNHATGLNPMNKLYPWGEDLKYNPWFNVNAPHGDNVYEDWNHDFEPAHQMFIRALQYWLEEYKVDGFRLDLSHGLCGAQGGNSVRNIKDYYEKGVKAVSPDAYMILEHWGDNCDADRKELIAAGMLCWDNTVDAYYQTAKGYTSGSFSNANRDGYVSYCESHDEERSFFLAKHQGAGDLKTNDKARIARVPLNMAFLTLLNGPQMFYHFAEFGFDYSKWQSKDGRWGKNDDGKAPYGISGVADYNYKMEAKMRPESWLGEGAWRTQAFHKVGQAIQLRTRLMTNVFEGNPTKSTLSGVVRTIQWGSDVFVAGNFSVSEEKTVTIPTGVWYNYYEQTPQAESTVTLAPGQLLILTGSPQVLPTMQASYMSDSAVEDIYMPETSTGIYPPYNVTIYTVSGQAVSIQRNVEQVDMSGLNNGLFLIQLEKNGQRVTQKVIR